MNRTYDIILFGATGFTGRLVAEYLFQKYGCGQDLKWAIAARNQEKLQQVRQELDPELPLLTADSHDLESLEKIAAQTKVMCTTVGPYALNGSLLVEACLKNGTHYCDITGEIPWIKRMIEQHHDAAAQKQVKIVHCCGFDSIPSDMGVHFLQQQAKQKFDQFCRSIKMRVKATRGGLSGGTYASLNNVLQESRMDPAVADLLANPYGLNPPDRQAGMDKADQQEVVYDQDFDSWTAPFVMAAINTRVVRRSHALASLPYSQDFCYEEAMLTGKGFSGKISARIMNKVIQQLTRKSEGLLKKFADYILPDPGQGPSEVQRSKGFFALLMLGKLPDGTEIKAKIGGDRDPGYGSTSKMLGESAVCLAQDTLPPTYGVLTPSIAMGNALLDRLQKHAGLQFQLIN